MAMLTVRIDAEVEQALDELVAARRTTRSEATKAAILDAARELRRAQLRAEAQRLRDDPVEVAAAKALAAEMGEISAW